MKLHHLRGCQKGKQTEERKESVLWVLQETDTEIELGEQKVYSEPHMERKEAGLGSTNGQTSADLSQPAGNSGAKIPVRESQWLGPSKPCSVIDWGHPRRLDPWLRGILRSFS